MPQLSCSVFGLALIAYPVVVLWAMLGSDRRAGDSQNPCSQQAPHENLRDTDLGAQGGQQS